MSLANNLNALIVKTTTKYFRTLVIVTIILIFVICYFLFIDRKIGTVREYQDTDYEGRVQLLAEQEDYLEGMKEMNVEYRKWTEEEINRINNSLPSDPDYPGLFTQFNQMITDAGYNLSSLNIEKVVSLKSDSRNSGSSAISSSHQALSLTAGIEAPEGYGYDNFQTLLKTIENNLRLIDVLSFNFTPDSQSFRLNLKTYYLSP